MRLRLAVHAVSTLALAFATPALAGEKHRHNADCEHAEHHRNGAHGRHATAGVSQSGTYDGTWRGEWAGPDGQVYEGSYQGTYIESDGYEVPVGYRGRWVGQGGVAADSARYYERRGEAGWDYAAADAERRAWFDDCLRSGGPSGVGGAVVGGAIGGLVGNRVAGRGNRTVGTVLGAGVGAVAGAALERGSARERVRRECEAYLLRAEADAGYVHDYDAGPPPVPHSSAGVRGVARDYDHGAVHGRPLPVPQGPVMGSHGGHVVYAGAGHHMAGPGYAPAHYGYAPHPGGYYAAPVMMVPVITVGGGKRDCVETVTETVEYVDVRSSSRKSRR